MGSFVEFKFCSRNHSPVHLMPKVQNRASCICIGRTQKEVVTAELRTNLRQQIESSILVTFSEEAGKKQTSLRALLQGNL